MTGRAVRVVVEATPKKTFATAIDWPGWSRSGKTREAALESLLAYRDRYARAIAGSGDGPPAAPEPDIVEELDGGAGTEFGVPSSIAAADRQPLSKAEAERRAAIVRAAWATVDRTAGHAPESLRKGPRGGGRDTSKIVAHLVDADAAYAKELGVPVKVPDPADRAAVEAMRAGMLGVLARASDGSPITKRWTPRYAAQRIAWHALDHAWEIEDRSRP
ncbi:MAG TPA: hypothetical protein VF484_04995 [Candidatus Limnocylindrales bacterium]